jgi:hypothetical protein
MGMLVRAMVRRVLVFLLAHSGIVPPDIGTGNPA